MHLFCIKSIFAIDKIFNVQEIQSIKAMNTVTTFVNFKTIYQTSGTDSSRFFRALSLVKFFKNAILSGNLWKHNLECSYNVLKVTSRTYERRIFFQNILNKITVTSNLLLLSKSI